MRNSGFTNIVIRATGGWHLALAQMLGLWLKRSPINRLSKMKYNILAKFIHFSMLKLIKLGQYDNVLIQEGQMINGLYGCAYKA